MARTPRDHTRYELKDGKTIVYRGITTDPERRKAEHEADGKRFTTIKVAGPKVTEQTAREWEQQSLETYRNNHGGQNPKYNETDHG